MDSSREFSCPVDSSSSVAAQRHPESKVHVQSNSAWFLFVNHEEKYYLVVQPSDLQWGSGCFTSTCKAPPCPCHVPGQQPQHQHGSRAIKQADKPCISGASLQGSVWSSTSAASRWVPTHCCTLLSVQSVVWRGQGTFTEHFDTS